VAVPLWDLCFKSGGIATSQTEVTSVVSRIGVTEMLTMLVAWLIPLVVLGWLLSLANRAVRALESIAESLRSHNKQP
jgi:hypothetical protein